MGARSLALDRADVRRGVVLGIAAFVVISAILVIIAAIPATRDFLDDDRADVSTVGMLYELCVPILLVTVLPEEFVFRGALLGSVLEEWGVRRAVLASSVLFGLWHISPTLNTLSENDQLHDATTSGLGRFGLVVGSVLATFVAGLVFSYLRLRSRSLVAPVFAHLATNATAFFLAWLVVR
jgi:membrane protease YdiL (CAAX protease family)